MIPQRLRAILAGVPAAALAIVIAAASPVLAAESLRITSPVAGSIVSGDTLIGGSIAGDGAVDIELGFAPQTFGDCGAPTVTTTLAIDAGSSFSATLSTTDVADGTYCVIAIADDGRLSDVVGDIVVDNSFVGEEVEAFQLPTESFDESGVDPQMAATKLSADPLADSLSVMGAVVPAVLGAAAVLAMLVIVLGVVLRRPSTD